MGGIIAPKHGEGCICLLQQSNKHQYKYTGCNSQMSVKDVGKQVWLLYWIVISMWRCKEWVCSCMHKAVQWPEFKVWLSLRTGNMWWTRKHFHVMQSFQKDSVLLTAENKCNVEGLIHECTNMKTQETGEHLNISPTRAAHEIVHGNLGYRKMTASWGPKPPNATIRCIKVYGTSIWLATYQPTWD